MLVSAIVVTLKKNHNKKVEIQVMKNDVVGALYQQIRLNMTFSTFSEHSG